MSLSKVEIIRGQGNLGGTITSRDGDSGFLFIDAAVVTPEEFVIYSEKEFDDKNFDVDDYAILKFHVSEYFRFTQSPLYISIQSADANFDKIVNLQTYANGAIRNFAIFDNKVDFSTANVTKIQARLQEIEDVYAPANAIYTASLGVGNVEALTDLNLLANPRVGVVISEDIDGTSAELRAVTGVEFVSNIGTCLGMLSSKRVHENIGWVETSNLAGDEMNIPGFIDGTTIASKAASFLNALDDKRYIFMIKYVGSDGVFFNYDYTAIPDTSDYSSLSLNRVFDKAFRLLYAGYLPKLNSPSYVDPDSGKLSIDTISVFKNIGINAIQPMETAKEISGFSIYINPDQIVLTTKKLEVTLDIVPVGTNKTISVTTSYKLKLG